MADEAAWVDLAAADRDLAAAEDEVVRVQAECRQREGRVQAEAAAGRRQAAQQAKWAVVSMQKLGVQMRCDALLQPQPEPEPQPQPQPEREPEPEPEPYPNLIGGKRVDNLVGAQQTQLRRYAVSSKQ